MSGTVKVRLLHLSDTHFGRSPEYSSDGAFRPQFPQADVLLHSGDLSMVGTLEEYRRCLSMLASIKAELKLVIAGNHDLSLHKSYFLNDKDEKGKSYAQKWMGWGNKEDEYDEALADQAEELWRGPEADRAGVIYLTEGTYKFQLKSGARLNIYVSPWQPEFFNWAFNYPRDEDRWNPPHLTEGVKPAPPERDPHPIPEGIEIDVVMTHGPAKMHLDKCRGVEVRAGCEHLLRALKRVRPSLFCFGHIHEGWGAERVFWDGRGGANAGDAGPLGETKELIGGTDDGEQGVTEKSSVIRPSDEEVVDQRAAYVDLSSTAKTPLQRGEETLFTNACAVDFGYKPANAGWLVDLELPKA